MVDLDRQDVALRALVEDVVAQVRATGRTLDVAMDVADDLVVAGDPARLRQLLVNVVDNAARHAPAETSVRITAGADSGADDGPAGGSWWLEVVDAGGGVAPEDRDRVFERFGTDGAGGTGLGLAVARWVAQLHGGTLRFLDPEAGQGARIRLEVPGERATAVLTSPTPVPSAASVVVRTDRRGAGDHPATAVRAGRRVRSLLARPRRPARAPDRRRRGGGRARRRRRPVVHRGRHHLDAGRADVRCGRAGHRASATRAVDPRCARDWPCCSCCR